MEIKETKNKIEENLIIPKNLNTYLGQKGYTILKKEIDIKIEDFIRTQLTIKPFTLNNINNNNQKVYPAYRESNNKFYVPRYFGEEYFGLPKIIKISEGENMNLVFNGNLRDYQSPVVEKYLNFVLSKYSQGGLLELHTAWGKTSASLYIASKIGKKTLVIVHKEFLMNQWIERINQFLPSARIGKIQGQIIDIDNKDIVLCMLQSLSMKDYPASLFDSFGFTIIDEVHHISSETFSNALFKIVTKYMLGLSATMNRKDGTTFVFKMFLGPVVHKTEKREDNNLEVRALNFYVDNDDEYNETILDYKGQPLISSNVSKICSYNRRTEFIIKVLNDFITIPNIDKNIIKEHKEKMDKENPECLICKTNSNYLMKNTCCNCVKYCMNCLDNIVEYSKNNVETIIDKKTGIIKSVKRRAKCPNCKKLLEYEQNYIENKYILPKEQRQTLILAHNLNILEYIYKKFVCKNLASVGYYVGGMSEKELKKSETKQVILATYQMSSEGLDIPSLNAEFMISPKTDIVQSVGRILRAKHAFNKPIIYDFIDSHDIFKKQWNKRKTFYKSNNYKIIQIDNRKYLENNSIVNWNIIYSPKEEKEEKQEKGNKKDKLKSLNFQNLKVKIKKNISSSSRSITDDSEDDNEDEDKDENETKSGDDNEYKINEETKTDKYNCGKCLLKILKKKT